MFNQDMFYLTQLIVNFGQEGKNVNVLEVRTKFHSAITRPNVVLNHPHVKGFLVIPGHDTKAISVSRIDSCYQRGTLT